MCDGIYYFLFISIQTNLDLLVFCCFGSRNRSLLRFQLFITWPYSSLDSYSKNYFLISFIHLDFTASILSIVFKVLIVVIVFVAFVIGQLDIFIVV